MKHEDSSKEARNKRQIKVKSDRIIYKQGLSKDIAGNDIEPGDIVIVSDTGYIIIGICSHYCNSTIAIRAQTLDGREIKGFKSLGIYTAYRNVTYDCASEMILNLSKLNEFKLVKIKK